MTIDELRKDRFNIYITALQEGMEIPYKMGWSIFLSDNILYQACFSPTLKRDIVHKSNITFTELMSFIAQASDADLITVFGNIRLLRLQKKFMEEEKDKSEE